MREENGLVRYWDDVENCEHPHQMIQVTRSSRQQGCGICIISFVMTVPSNSREHLFIVFIDGTHAEGSLEAKAVDEHYAEGDFEDRDEQIPTRLIT